MVRPGNWCPSCRLFAGGCHADCPGPGAVVLEIDVPADDCERCPFFHDEANACEASDMRELEGAYAKRPDWCPLDKGPVLVQVRK